jgi:hypothetical protein
MSMIVYFWLHSLGVSTNIFRLRKSSDCDLDLLVGSGSFAFHSTLKCKCYGVTKLLYISRGTNLYSDPMQLVDELSMIYTACLMCYATFSFARSQITRQLLGLGLVSLAIFITVSCTTAMKSPPRKKS